MHGKFGAWEQDLVPPETALLLGGCSPFAFQLCLLPTAGKGGSFIFPDVRVLSIHRLFLPCGIGRVVNECKGQGDLPRLGGGYSELMGEHASLCARMLTCACMDTHVAAPLFGAKCTKAQCCRKGRGSSAGLVVSLHWCQATQIWGAPRGSGVKPASPEPSNGLEEG